MSRTTRELPAGYRETGRIGLLLDSGLKRRLTVSSVAVLTLFLLLGNFLMPVITLGLDRAGEPARPWLMWSKIGSMVLIYLFHGLLLERMKGALMKKLGGMSPVYGFQAGATYAGSPVFFSKKDHRIITLLPLILMAALFFLLTLLLPPDWFWVGYAAQVINLAGGVTHYYAAFQAARRHPEVLIQDPGPQLIFYEPSPEPIEGRPARKAAAGTPASGESVSGRSDTRRGKKEQKEQKGQKKRQP